MKKQYGRLTVVELFIITVIAIIFVSLGTKFWAGVQGNSNITFSVNGVVESTCIEGYKFTIDQQGNARQILDEFGKGAKCGTTADATVE